MSADEALIIKLLNNWKVEFYWYNSDFKNKVLNDKDSAAFLVKVIRRNIMNLRHKAIQMITVFGANAFPVILKECSKKELSSDSEGVYVKTILLELLFFFLTVVIYITLL